MSYALPPRRKRYGICSLCHRTTALTFHHLIPKKMHRRSHFKKHYTKSELAAGINICRKCHDGIHKTYTEMELAKQLNTLQLLCSDDKLGTYFAWVAKQKIHS